MTEDKQPNAAGKFGQRIIFFIIAAALFGAGYYVLDWFFGGL